MLYTVIASALTAASLAATNPPAIPAPAVASHDAASLALLHALKSWDHDRPGIRLWTTDDDVYHRGDRAHVYFRTERDAYVTIFRVDTDGRVRVLYPRDPTDDNYVSGGATYMVSNWRRGEAFLVDDDPGVGYVFGVAADDPFMYDAIEANQQWYVQNVADRIHGDPYASMMDVVDRLLPDGYADYDTHLIPYYVDRRYQYPRFVCYDCHAYVGYSMWNPYGYSCSRFSLVVYNDPFYFYPSYWYPTRYYGGTRVVYVRPRAGDPGRYVFRDRGGPNAPPIVYRQRPTDVAMTPADRGVRGRDLGGVGSIPAPGVPGSGRRVVGGGAGGGGVDTRGNTGFSDPPIVRGPDRPVIDNGGGNPPPNPGNPGNGGNGGNNNGDNGRRRGGDNGIGNGGVPGNGGVNPRRNPNSADNAMTDVPMRRTPRSGGGGAVLVDPGSGPIIRRNDGVAPSQGQAPIVRPNPGAVDEGGRRGIGQPVQRGSASPQARPAEPRSQPQPRQAEPRQSPPPRAEPRSNPQPRGESSPKLERRRSPN